MYYFVEATLASISYITRHGHFFAVLVAVAVAVAISLRPKNLSLTKVFQVISKSQSTNKAPVSVPHTITPEDLLVCAYLR